MLSQTPRFLWSHLIIPACCLFPAMAARAQVATRGFTVDTSNRSEVTAFYHRYHQASEGYRERMGWTGNYTSTAAGAEGTVSSTFAGDVERRINYFRALAGVPATVRVNTGSVITVLPSDAWQPAASTTKVAAIQRSALMIARGYPGVGGLSHDPPQSTPAWTTAAWNGNRNGNLALGFFGPGAVDAYVRESVSGISSWNVDVGHRRWLMCHWSTDFATGDTPGVFNPTSNTIRPPTNAMYVVPRASEVNFAAPRTFHSFPSAGYFPAEHNSPFWSLSFPEADFSTATVTLRDASLAVVPVTVVSRRTGFGDHSIVWQVPASVATTEVTADRRWHVTVSGIKGTGVGSSHAYEVILFDPWRTPESPQVKGNPAPLISGGSYEITGIPASGEVEAGFFLRLPADWTEGAEGTPGVISATSPNYSFLATTAGYVKSGQRAFRMTFPTRYDPLINGVPEQQFELGRELLPGAGSKLHFHYRRGLMTPASRLVVETSADDGVSWAALATYQGLGGNGDATYQAASLSLPSSASPLRVRFRYFLADSSAALYAHEDYPKLATGVFIDDISMSGGDWLEPRGSVVGPSLAAFDFNPATAGTSLAIGQVWWLRARPVLGGRPFAWGSPRVVVPTGPLQLTGTATPPVSGAAYSFLPAPAATSHIVEISEPGHAQWTEGAEASPTPQVTTGVSGAYSVLSDLKGFRKSGTRAFRLGLSTLTDEEDFIRIDREAVPSAGSALEFWFRRGPMAVTNRLDVEISTDDGATWTIIHTLPALKKPDKVVTRSSTPLAAWAGQRVKFRFALRNAPGTRNLKWNAKKSGIWLDDITVTAPASSLWSNQTVLAGGVEHFLLDDGTAGRPLTPGQVLQLRVRGVVGGSPGPWGPPLAVTMVAAEPMVFPLWSEAKSFGEVIDFDADTDGDGVPDGVEYAFSLDGDGGAAAADEIALVGDRFEISRPLAQVRDDVEYLAEWSDDLNTWSRDGVEIRLEAGRIIASVERGSSGRRMMRWVVLPR